MGCTLRHRGRRTPGVAGVNTRVLGIPHPATTCLPWSPTPCGRAQWAARRDRSTGFRTEGLAKRFEGVSFDDVLFELTRAVLDLALTHDKDGPQGGPPFDEQRVFKGPTA